jgi:uncharacterized membrane protein YccC
MRHAALVFSLRTFAAAMLAFTIALLLDMPRPYWAMASVYITSNVLAGATGSKAVYRILGTLIGAAGTIVLVPNLANAPELLSLAIALWVGTCLYLSLIDGTPRSYAFMLAGYTVALLGFPVVSIPQATFDIVVSRVQEITLGIVCASVVAMLVFPRSVVSAITAQADAWLGSARRLAVEVLTGRGGDQAHDSERTRLAAAASEIDQLAVHLDYEAATSANVVRGLRRLRQHMLSLLPLLGSIEDRTLALDADDGALARSAEVRTRIARWLEQGGSDGKESDALRAALDDIGPLGEQAGWIDVTIAGLAFRLRNLVDVMQDCRLLREAIADGRNPESLPLAFPLEAPTVTIPHRDHGQALLTVASVALAVLACSAFWIATGWTDGVTAPLFAAVIGSLLAGVDDPLPTFRNFYGLFLLVIAIHGIYVFGVLPRITTFEMLIVALMPTFLLFGWMAARPATARIGSMLAIYFSTQLALTSTYTADFDSFANSSVALMVGVALTGVICGIVRLLGAEWIANRLLRSNWQTLAAVAEGDSQQDRVAIASLMQHRLALLAARIAVVPAEARSDAANLRQLRTALSIIDIRQASAGLSRRTRTAIDAFLAHLAAIGSNPAAGPLPDSLVGQLDSAIAFTLQDTAGNTRDAALVGLAGARTGLFPDAPAYQPPLLEKEMAA